MKKPKSIWIILDPLDGNHVFCSKKEAWKLYNKWKKEAEKMKFDSFWDMLEPLEYIKK